MKAIISSSSGTTNIYSPAWPCAKYAHIYTVAAVRYTLRVRIAGHAFHTYRVKQIFFAEFIQRLPRCLLNNSAQQMRICSRIGKDLAGLISHRTVKHKLYPVIRITPCRLILSICAINAGSMRKQMSERNALPSCVLPVIQLRKILRKRSIYTFYISPFDCYATTALVTLFEAECSRNELVSS